MVTRTRLKFTLYVHYSCG